MALRETWCRCSVALQCKSNYYFIVSAVGYENNTDQMLNSAFAFALPDKLSISGFPQAKFTGAGQRVMCFLILLRNKYDKRGNKEVSALLSGSFC